MSNLRRLLVSNSKPKYTVLEYLEGTGTQYITLDYNITYNSIIDCEFSFSEIPSTAGAIFGYRENSTNPEGNVYWIGAHNSPKVIFARLGTGNDGSTNIDIVANEYHRYEIKEDHYFYYDGEKVGDNFIVSPNINLDKTGLFRLYMPPSSGSNFTPLKGKMKYFRIIENGKIVVDLIPVLNESGTACMYDRANNKFYYNQGTGEFSYKKWDKTDLSYIQLDGSSYVDTGYIPNQKTSFLIKYEINEPNTTETATSPYGTVGNITPTDLDGGILRTKNGRNTFNRVGWGTGEGSNKTIVDYNSLDTIYEDYYDTNIVYINGTNVATLPNTQDWSSPQTLIINSRHNADGTVVFSPNSATYYSASASENGVDIFKYESVLDENGFCGFYDEITNKIIYDYNKTAKGFIVDKTGESYQIGNYVESSGTQYIDTNMLINGNYTIEAEVNPLNTGGFFYWGTGGYNPISTAYNLWPVNSSGSSKWDTAYFTFYYSSLIANEFNKIIQNKDGVYINGGLVRSYVGGVNPSPYTMWLFKGNSNNVTQDSYNSGSIQIKRFKLYNENNKLVLSLLPTTRMSDNVVGMYDTISNIFFTNSGTGDFIIG